MLSLSSLLLRLDHSLVDLTTRSCAFEICPGFHLLKVTLQPKCNFAGSQMLRTGLRGDYVGVAAPQLRTFSLRRQDVTAGLFIKKRMPPVVLVLKCFLQFGYSVLFCAEECACSWKRSSRHQGGNCEIANMHLQIRSWLPWSNPNITEKRKKRPLKVTTGNFKLGYVSFLFVEFEKVLIQFYLYNSSSCLKALYIVGSIVQ